MAAFETSTKFVAFDLASLSERKPKHIHRILGEIINLIESKILHPVHHITTCPIEHIEEEFRFISTGKHIGKIVLGIELTAIVKCLPAKSASPLLQLRKDGIDRPIDEIRIDQSLEPKNWMVRTFVPSQPATSELGSAGSLMALPATVASRQSWFLTRSASRYSRKPTVPPSKR